MKLKEKMADEAMDRIVKHGDISVPFIAWLDGFEKAREMAARIHYDNLGSGGMCDFGENEGQWKFEKSCLNMGEEEV